jgi:hypothetical protein
MWIYWRFEGGRGTGDAGSGRRRRWLTRAGEMLEVEGDLDMRGRPVNERREGEGEMGRRRVRWAACPSGKKGRRGRRACSAVQAEKGRKVEVGRAVSWATR